MGEPGDLNTGVFLIFEDENKRILWVKHGYGDKKWSLPGGGVRLAEMANRAAEREAREETGLKIIDIELIAIGSLQKKYGVVLLFQVFDYSGEIKVNGKEITEAKYMKLEEMPDNEVYRAQKKLAEIHDRIRYYSKYPVYCTLGEPPIIET